MRLAILMSSAALAALTVPALADNDRYQYQEGNGCNGASPQCLQQQFAIDGGDRSVENAKTGSPAGNLGGTTTAARSNADDDNLSNEFGDAADETGDAISSAADETGDRISHAANEAGDAIDSAADEVGDAFH
jgi:hypothetical protein